MYYAVRKRPQKLLVVDDLMIRARYIEARTYVHATEDKAKVLKALEQIIGNGNVVEEYLKGYFGNPIIVLTSYKEKEEADQTFNSLVHRLTQPDRNYLLMDLENRVDKNGFLYMRFDKQRAYLGKLMISDSDDVIRVTVKFSGSRKEVVEELKKLLGTEGGQ